MIVNKLDLLDGLDYLILSVENIPNIDKNLYIIGGCGLLEYGIYSERDTNDLDIFYPDAMLLPSLSDKFHIGSCMGVSTAFPENLKLKICELFQGLDNEVLEDYIIENSIELKNKNNLKIFLPPLEALVANKVQSYETYNERIKDKSDVLKVLEYKKDDGKFHYNLMRLLEECKLVDRYKKIINH